MHREMNIGQIIVSHNIVYDTEIPEDLRTDSPEDLRSRDLNLGLEI